MACCSCRAINTRLTPVSSLCRVNVTAVPPSAARNVKLPSSGAGPVTERKPIRSSGSNTVSSTSAETVRPATTTSWL
jgi:hypothetical protein